MTACCSADDSPEAVRTIRLVVGPFGEGEGLAESVGLGAEDVGAAESVAVG
jgi:hypothetical protein